MSEPAKNLPSGFRGLHLYRLASNPIERIYAERWAEINKTGHILEHILSSGGDRKADPSERDYAVAATVVQWLGTIVGQGFLEEVARRASLPKTEPGGLAFAEHEVAMLRQLLGNTQLRVSLKGASLERVKRALPLGWVKLADWPTPVMHPFMDKVRRLLVHSEKMVDEGELPKEASLVSAQAIHQTVKQPQASTASASKAELVVESAIEAQLCVVFSDPGMKDKTVRISPSGGSLTKILRAEEKARNYTTAKIQAGGVTIATLYRPLGSMSFQTVAPDPEDR